VNETVLLVGLGLLGAALLLIFVEVFVPSGGLISLVAAICGIAGLWQLFRYDATWGVIGMLVMMVLTPIAIAFALRVMPSTPVGRRLIYGDLTPEEADRGPTERARRQREELMALIGSEGLARTALRPVGAVEIGGKRYDALAESGYIPAGSRVRVHAVEDNQIKVRVQGEGA
jgi:membrane-bound ClpP family serine protease